MNKTIGPDAFIPVQLPLRQLEKPGDDEVHLWHFDFDRLSNPLSQDNEVHTRDLSVFQQRATRRFYLRLLLGAYLDLPGKDIHLTRRLKGRLELEATRSSGELDFSVARSNQSYLVGISNGATIGVDLEMAARRAGRPMALARRYFSDAETTALSAFGEDGLQRAFVHTWACKEAIVKANGLGIANQLCRFTVDVNPDNPASVLDMADDDPTTWKLAVVEPADGLIAAVAVRQQTLQVKGFRLT